VNSPYLFAWADVQARLDRTAPDPEGRFGRRIELGGPALSSVALHMNRLESGTQTRSTRTTANQIICVAEGAGTSVIDGQSLNWQRGDVFAMPGWRPFHNTATRDATLFEMSDEPVMKTLGWLRTSD
jgi:gentisate 1,2-dioxygenase